MLAMKYRVAIQFFDRGPAGVLLSALRLDHVQGLGWVSLAILDHLFIDKRNIGRLGGRGLTARHPSGRRRARE